jgi:3-deoxy-D-manno-octulosonate 8-phosphate phosphatase KdsC-like HAD superfamily phosphatase
MIPDLILCEKGFFVWEHILFDGIYGSITPEYFTKKKIIVSDCDGVLTNGNHIYNSEGKEYKVFGSCDKEALRFMLKCGWQVLFVTEDPTGIGITYARLGDWGGIHIHSPKNVLAVLTEGDGNFDIDFGYTYASPSQREEMVCLLKKAGYYVAYIGDSLSDTHPGMAANVFCTPGNAIETAKNLSDRACSTSKIGGEGAFADIMYKLHYKVGTGNQGLVNL